MGGPQPDRAALDEVERVGVQLEAGDSPAALKGLRAAAGRVADRTTCLEELAQVAQKSGADGSTPSGNAVAAHVLLRLHHLTAEDHYRMRAEEILRLYRSEAATNPFAYATLLQALELSTEGPAEVVVAGVPGAPDTEALWAAVASVYLPHHVLVSSMPGAAETLPPARGRPQVDGRATAYVCRNFVCSAPVTDPSALRPLLEAAHG